MYIMDTFKGIRQTSEVVSRPFTGLRQPPGISELNPGLS